MRFPRAIERAYAARLLRRQAAARTLLEERADAEGGIGAAVQRGWASVVSSARRAFELAFPLDAAAFGGVARSVDAFSTAGLISDLRRGGITLEGEAVPRPDALARLHAEWSRENLRIVRGMEIETLDDIASAVVQAARDADSAELERVLADRWRVGAGRARLIARDQTGKLSSQIAFERARVLGVQRYRWVTERDERVRPSHRKLDGSIRLVNEPHPTEGHPGSAIACRCTAMFLTGGVE